MAHHLEGHTGKRTSLLFLLKGMVAGRVHNWCNITHCLTTDKAVENTASLEAEHALDPNKGNVYLPSLAAWN